MAITIQTPPDKYAPNAGVILSTGRKLAVQHAVNEATSRLKHPDIVDKVCIVRQRMGDSVMAHHTKGGTPHTMMKKANSNK